MIYTAITDKKDKPRKDITCLNGYNRFKTGRMNAKVFKVLPHLYLDDEYTIWIDGNLHLKVSEEELLQLAEGHDVTVFRHPYRSSVYEEAEECKKIGLDDADVIDQQMQRYMSEGFVSKDLACCFLIIRKNTPEVNRLNEQWWAEICRGSSRDQLSFPYVFRDVNYIYISNIKDNLYFTRKGHLK